MTLAFFSVSLLSCSKEKETEKTTYVSIFIPHSESDFSLVKTDLAKVFDKLKELKFIGGYSGSLASSYTISPFFFDQNDVSLSDTAKVKISLIAKAQSHYADALKKVEEFDFNTLYTEDVLAEKIGISVMPGEKTYAVEIMIQRPLIWDKVWSTNDVGCPIQKMSFVQNKKDVVGKLLLQNGSEIGTLNVTRFYFREPLIVTNDDYRYFFKVLSSTEIQLVQLSPDGRDVRDVSDKNYVFTPQK